MSSAEAPLTTKFRLSCLSRRCNTCQPSFHVQSFRRRFQPSRYTSHFPRFFPQHDRHHKDTHSCPSSSATVHDRSLHDPHLLPSSPTIATLPGTTEKTKNGLTRNGNHSSHHASITEHRPSLVTRHSPRSRPGCRCRHRR